MIYAAGARVDIRPSKALSFLGNPPRNHARSPLQVGSRNMKKSGSSQKSDFSPTKTPPPGSWFLPLIVAHKDSTLSWLVDDQTTLHPLTDSGAYTPNSTYSDTAACATAPYQVFRDSGTSPLRAICSRKTSHRRSEEAQLAKKPSRHNQAANACKPSG